jgi:hypothetical protein
MRRLSIALLVSIVLNLALFAVDFSIDPRQEAPSRTQHLVVVLLTPAEALTTRPAPGHGGAQIVALVLFSIVAFAIMSWVTLSLAAWWKQDIALGRRQQPRPRFVVGEKSLLHSSLASGGALECTCAVNVSE